MTKAQLIAALERLPDDASVLVESWPTGKDAPNEGDLFPISEVLVTDMDGPGAPAFASILADVRYES